MGWYWAWRGIKGKLFGDNRKVPWPVHTGTVVNGAENISFPQESIHVFQVPGCYWQAIDARINIGKNCHIAPNVGVITTNHDIHDPRRHVPGKDITIGDNCWVGMNSVILPGVVLGENTVVAAGAAVTKSFPEGHCVIGGVPAKIIKTMEK
ncbi:MAG: acyltransferase [Clostridiales bacterium]|nr:acyltransferase [Clostridiales bacterium]